MEAMEKGGNVMVVTGGFVFVRDADSGLGGGAEGGAREYGWDGDWNGRLIKWGGYCSNHNLSYRD